ncbi:MAG: acylphosphatase [Candidatus Brockarchaeota archaeon]|nr:acylphosphatase [Candidatus Brockarchaeota archaeon]
MKKKIVIKGDRVQDVGYRLFLLDAAEDLGLKGFQARNIKDYVEFIVEGDDGRVIEFVKFAKSNYPEFAKVDEVREEDYDGEVMSMDRFYHRFSVDQLVKIVNVGIGMIGRQDTMIEKQDLMLKKQDTMIEKQDLMLGRMDLMLEKQDEMLRKQDETIMEIRALREDLRSYMEERFEKIEREIAAIKAKIGL